MLPDIIPQRFGGLTPWRQGYIFSDLQKSMTRMMREFMSDSPTFSREWDVDTTAFVPRIDVRESEDKVALSAELPGLTEKDVEVQVDKDFLTIRGEKRAEKESKEGGRTFSERHFGVFERTIRLPSAIDKDKITAKFNHGVLNIELPKTAEAKHDIKKIPIKH